VKNLLRMLMPKPMFSDGEIDLTLSREDVRDEECGIDDGFNFSIYLCGTRRYVGYVSLRLGESPGLYYLGHIGYRVEEEHRGHHYAEKACRLLIPLMQRLNLESVVITNNVDNLPSRKTCERLGCALERIAPVPREYRLICGGARQKCRYIWRVPPRE